VYHPYVNRLFDSQLIQSRITDEERKDLIQLLLFFTRLAEGFSSSIDCEVEPLDNVGGGSLHASNSNSGDSESETGTYQSLSETEEDIDLV
jgi:hypothetical protein